jgi:hypothetical protein
MKKQIQPAFCGVQDIRQSVVLLLVKFEDLEYIYVSCKGSAVKIEWLLILARFGIRSCLPSVFCYMSMVFHCFVLHREPSQEVGWGMHRPLAFRLNGRQ